MNPHLAKLQPYPFEKLRQLFAGVAPNPELREIRLSIGEPQHRTPDFIKAVLSERLAGLANYPTTLGSPELRHSIAAWLERRYGLPGVDPETQIIPVNGSREALFAFVQAAVDPTRDEPPLVVCPNPFYQIYEGAAYLAGAQPRFLNTVPENGYALDFSSLSEAEWQRVQLVFVCSPGNPTGKILSLDDWQQLFLLADRYGFVIAADECYSEIYFDEDRPPLGGLQAARLLGHDGRRLVVFSSLSKRSNVPGMRSGFVAGDPAILASFLLYRTYHGCAMNPAVQAASAAAWNDEAHVIENRRAYREKFAAVTPLLADALGATWPEAGFYLWLRTPIDDTEFARRLLAAYNVLVLPGSYLARLAHGVNPGAGFVRIALVAARAECIEAAERIRSFTATL
ncbi:MAG TPA: succinyldiaminopimelate transaminase [Accumulibacter sp.]|uniref:succinyldiaminopimelate transaminase n=2 Tax=Accumulibacter sp. TaxID=2053492 RepID=UPI002CF81F81|nr:succinyldiaminopimelate transaminase [Accumulibacter sp.]HMW63073.1 succinyldiaminopimelate transaminase [Accumulibacter sp.]HMW79612.1 succinyldiaminopimelate transaminase [Accumulibacter sp.]HMX68408.1 succinyldiaminopimelate transaminase [Accumulibacter sp.]HND39113.1 succinyldiaminopimelate transaminase [Accumulibacter sp.]HNE40601.1 succinyldiaminopimelate transaminase [Accumulibacter sp.]